MLNGNSGRHAIALLSVRRNKRVVDPPEFAAQTRPKFRKRRITTFAHSNNQIPGVKFFKKIQHATTLNSLNLNQLQLITV